MIYPYFLFDKVIIIKYLKLKTLKSFLFYNFKMTKLLV